MVEMEDIKEVLSTGMVARPILPAHMHARRVHRLLYTQARRIRWWCWMKLVVAQAPRTA